MSEPMTTELILKAEGRLEPVRVTIALSWREIKRHGYGPWLEINDDDGVHWCGGPLWGMPRLNEIFNGGEAALVRGADFSAGYHQLVEHLISHEGWLAIYEWLTLQGVYPRRHTLGARSRPSGLSVDVPARATVQR